MIVQVQKYSFFVTRQSAHPTGYIFDFDFVLILSTEPFTDLRTLIEEKLNSVV